MSPPARGSQGGRRRSRVRVRTARGRRLSSTRWLERQLNDPYVSEAKRLGYRSRAAFKLIELDEKYGLLKGVRNAVDLGAAPGGWTQVLVQKLKPGARIIAVDIAEFEPVAGADCLQLDFLMPHAPERIAEEFGVPVDLVLSDMAAPTTGHRQTDHLRTMALCEAAFAFARDVLAPGGAFVAKVLEGGTSGDLLAEMKRHFRKVRHVKPPASRPESVEWYVVAQGFLGRADETREGAEPGRR